MKINIEETTPGNFMASCHTPDGCLIVPSTKTPLLSMARELQKLGFPDETELFMFRKDRADWDLKGTIGVAAKLIVRETNDAPRFAKYRPFEERFGKGELKSDEGG